VREDGEGGAGSIDLFFYVSSPLLCFGRVIWFCGMRLQGWGVPRIELRRGMYEGGVPISFLFLFSRFSITISLSLS
jgi:hypothetical protein